MPRGRKPSPDVAIDAAPIVDDEAVASASRAVTVVGERLRQIEEQFALLPYDRLRVLDETRFYMGQSAEAMLEAGKRLIQMKEAEPHGEFLDCLGALGVAPRTAQSMMRAALKFAPNAPTFAHLGRAKLLELAFLDDGDVAELAEGGTVAGLELDDVERMSVRELRAALREARADGDAKDHLLDEKNKKIDSLSAKRKHKLNPEAEARAAMVESVSEVATTIATAAGTLDELLGEADAQDMLADVATQERLYRAIHLAWLAFQRVYTGRGVCDVDDLNAAVFGELPGSGATPTRQ